MKATFAANGFTASKETSKNDANFALIGKFDGGEYRVISMHARKELARPDDVFNSRYSDILVARNIQNGSQP